MRISGRLLELLGLGVMIASTYSDYSFHHYVAFFIGLFAFGFGRRFSDVALEEKILKKIREKYGE